MVEINSAVQTLIKTMEETLKRCQMSVVYPKGIKKDEVPVKIEDDKSVVTFSSDNGSIKIELIDGKLILFCSGEKASSAKDSDYQKLFESLLELEDTSCDIRDVKSAANEVCESVSNYFGLSKGGTIAKQSKAAKKSNKNSTITYEPENLATRISNVFPELKEELEANTEKYEMTLAEEFFNEHANKLILDSIKDGNVAKTKKLFNIFNMFYEEGPKDTQSLIAVTILGINLKDDKQLFEKIEGYMDTDLKSAVTYVIKYLSTLKGKGEMKTLNNPKPYVSKKMKRIK